MIFLTRTNRGSIIYYLLSIINLNTKLKHIKAHAKIK